MFWFYEYRPSFFFLSDWCISRDARQARACPLRRSKLYHQLRRYNAKHASFSYQVHSRNNAKTKSKIIHSPKHNYLWRKLPLPVFFGRILDSVFDAGFNPHGHMFIAVQNQSKVKSKSITSGECINRTKTL